MVPPGDWQSPPGRDDAVRLATSLRAALGREGLHIVLPLAVAAFDDVSTAVGGPPMAALLEGAGGAFIVGDGGPVFFSRFHQERVPGRDPLDDYTRRQVARAVADALDGVPGVRHRIAYPFDGSASARPLPFQRLGRAAGLPAAGPLGIQVHPRFGPWWAYRALVIVAGPAVTVEAEPPLTSSCDACPAPCADACPGHAVAAATEFGIVRCAAHRQTSPGCFTSCAARLACPVGWPEKYSSEQLAFHMNASLAQIRNHGNPGRVSKPSTR